MLRIFLSIITLFSLYSFSDMVLNNSNTDIGNREVEYVVDCPMVGVELVLSYTDKDGFLTESVVTSFPWKKSVKVSPLKKVEMKGHLRYIDKEVMLKYLDLKVKIDVENKYLNVGDTILIENKNEEITNEDLISNSDFLLEVEAIDEGGNGYIPEW